MSNAIPFTSGKIHGERVRLRDYMGQSAKRGEPGFVMHSSALRAFVANPQKWLLVGEDEAEAAADAEESGEEVIKASTKAQAWGTLVDTLLTMPQSFDDLYQITPATYEGSKGTAPWTYKSPTCREWRDKKLAEGFWVVTHDELEQAEIAAGRIANDPAIAALVKNAGLQVHVTADWTDAATGIVVPCKTLIDVVGDLDGEYHDSIANLKTARDGSYKGWQNAIEKEGYDLQAAMELDIYNAAAVALGQKPREHYLHPIQENKPPYVIGRRELIEDQHLRTGRNQLAEALAKYAQCLKFGVWPGYDDPFPGKPVLNNGWTPMEATQWHIAKWA